jgi:hypothetical protein
MWRVISPQNITLFVANIGDFGDRWRKKTARSTRDPAVKNQTYEKKRIFLSHQVVDDNIVLIAKIAEVIEYQINCVEC